MEQTDPGEGGSVLREGTHMGLDSHVKCKVDASPTCLLLQPHLHLPLYPTLYPSPAWRCSQSYQDWAPGKGWAIGPCS